MSGRRPTLTRLVNAAADVVGDRASWLSDRAYRAVAVPLQWLDPVGWAGTADARLDDIRDRVMGMAATGRVAPAEPRRIQRDLARTREDIERIAPRLPVVRARVLAVRLAAYTEVLQMLTGRPATPKHRLHPRDAVVLAGAAAGVLVGVVVTAAGAAVVEGGGVVAAGITTAAGVAAVRGRRARKQRIEAVAGALTEIDEAVRGRNGDDPRVLDGDRRSLLDRALRSGRLDARGAAILHRIDAHLDDLLIRLVDDGLEADDAHLVRATVTRYLPDTLEPLLALADPRAAVRGRPAAVEVADQLASIENGLAEAARRPGRNPPETLLLLQGEFLLIFFSDRVEPVFLAVDFELHRAGRAFGTFHPQYVRNRHRLRRIVRLELRIDSPIQIGRIEFGALEVHSIGIL